MYFSWVNFYLWHEAHWETHTHIPVSKKKKRERSSLYKHEKGNFLPSSTLPAHTRTWDACHEWVNYDHEVHDVYMCVCVCVCVSTATDVLMNGTLCDNLFERLQEIGLATPIWIFQLLTARMNFKSYIEYKCVDCMKVRTRRVSLKVGILSILTYHLG
jgi:hypothetical protein